MDPAFKGHFQSVTLERAAGLALGRAQDFRLHTVTVARPSWFVHFEDFRHAVNGSRIAILRTRHLARYSAARLRYALPTLRSFTGQSVNQFDHNRPVIRAHIGSHAPRDNPHVRRDQAMIDRNPQR